MKKYLYFMVVLLSVSSGIYAQKTRHVKSVGFGSNIAGAPLELVKIPSGTFVRTENGGDNTGQRENVLISDFYISTREVTNVQYKEFVNWVRDSIAAYLLGGEYLNVNKKTGETTINWKYANKIDYNNPKIQEKLAPMMLDASKTLSHQPEIDPNKLVYLVEGVDYQEAAKPENQGRNPNEFIYRYEVKVYPDTLVWVRDFGYSDNEQMAVGYFSEDQYKNYPVVGVNWIQANAFCDWFGKQKINREQAQKKLAVGGVCRLPTEMEWAYAAYLNDNNPNLNLNLNKDNSVPTNNETIVETSSSSPVASNNNYTITETAAVEPQQQTDYEQSIATNLVELKKFDDTVPQHKSFWAGIFKKKQHDDQQSQVVATTNTNTDATNKKHKKHTADKKANQQQTVTANDDRAKVDAGIFLPVNTMNRETGKYGLSGMADNVSEWTATSYYEGGSNFESRFNPNISWGTINSTSDYERRKVVRGGSWKDIPRYKTINNRFFSDMYDAHSYIGFRVVVVNLPQ